MARLAAATIRRTITISPIRAVQPIPSAMPYRSNPRAFVAEMQGFMQALLAGFPKGVYPKDDGPVETHCGARRHDGCGQEFGRAQARDEARRAVSRRRFGD